MYFVCVIIDWKSQTRNSCKVIFCCNRKFVMPKPIGHVFCLCNLLNWTVRPSTNWWRSLAETRFSSQLYRHIYIICWSWIKNNDCWCDNFPYDKFAFYVHICKFICILHVFRKFKNIKYFEKSKKKNIRVVLIIF